MIIAVLLALLLGVALGFWLARQQRKATVLPPVAQNPAAAERERIYKDLHDDIGAKLLLLIHGAENLQQADLARAVMQDVRDVVSRSRRPAASLLQLMSEIEAEARQRLAAADAELLWEQEYGLPDQPLDQAQTLHLLRIGREAITNALRHGGARLLRVRAFRAGSELMLEITDNGQFRPDQIGEGRGTATMRERAQDLGGDIRWNVGTLGGTKVILRAKIF